jgi:hypothetical protein
MFLKSYPGLIEILRSTMTQMERKSPGDPAFAGLKRYLVRVIAELQIKKSEGPNEEKPERKASYSMDNGHSTWWK